MHPGQGPGLSLRDLGETGGSETVTLLESEIPAHTPRVERRTGGTGDSTRRERRVGDSPAARDQACRHRAGTTP